MVRIRWFWWVLAAVPAVVGVVSFAVFEVGDFRSSGLVAGIALSLGLLAVLLLWRRPWRGRQRLFGLLSAAPGLVLGLVALIGLFEGVPEFLQARGMFVDVDDQGPTAVAPIDDSFVLVGHNDDRGFIWFSEDGADWVSVEDPLLTDLELWDVMAVDSGVVAVGARADPTEAVILSSSDGLTWVETGRFSNTEHGTVPWAIAKTATDFVVISDIIGNDVGFHWSSNLSSWDVAEPLAVLDDGESGTDIACNETTCIGVGSHDATYRTDVDSNSGVAWVNNLGFGFDLVNHDFRTVGLTSISATDVEFVAVGNSTDGHGVAWKTQDGNQWVEITGQFNEMTVDGIAADDTNQMIFGHNPETGDMIVWVSPDGSEWDQQTLPGDFPQGSQVRSIAHNQNIRIAVGIDSDTLQTIVWISSSRQPWQHITTLEIHGTKPAANRP